MDTKENTLRLTTIVWFRRDLRIEDHSALIAAMKLGVVIPVFIWCPEEESPWVVGAASRWWLHHSLKSVKQGLEELGMRLVIRRGSSLEVLKKLVTETGATSIFWSRLYDPETIRRDTFVKAELTKMNIETKSFPGNLLIEPWNLFNKQAKPFQVFTPYWKALLSKIQGNVEGLSLSRGILEGRNPRKDAALMIQDYQTINPELNSVTVDTLELLPKIHWDEGLAKTWQPGTAGAKKCLTDFIAQGLSDYSVQRDFPAEDGVSMLSPHLHFGEITPQMIWHAVVDSGVEGNEVFLRQLGWREFAHYLLYHYPKTPSEPLRKDFLSFPWKNEPVKLKAWQNGYTGYPIVDAGMRQLWTIGWMHNRVRMIVGSFLVKDLMISWSEGARWFWDTLVDADLANNTLGWQWVGGCGADAAPYFRVFNPIIQGKKFDNKGEYVRRWVPELSRLPDEWIHCPWEAPELVLREAGVVLGRTYPKPIVDHAQARLQALEAFRSIREESIT